MDSAYDNPHGKAVKASKATKATKATKASKASKAAKVIDGHKATSPALLKPVGKCAEGLKGEQLSGYVLDAMMDFATQRLTKSKKNPPVNADFAVVCFRNDEVCIPAGDVTPLDILELFPMDNQSVILHLKGRYVKNFLKHSAQYGAVSSFHSGAAVTEAGIRLDSIDDERVYKLVTIDFLLRGEFGAEVMKQAERLDNCNMPLSNTLIQNIKRLTQKGETINR